MNGLHMSQEAKIFIQAIWNLFGYSAKEMNFKIKDKQNGKTDLKDRMEGLSFLG